MGLIQALFTNDVIFQSLLGDTFVLERRQRLPDGIGGWVIAYTSNGSVSGYIRPATSEEITTAQQEQRRITHVLYVDGDTDIARGDRATGAGLVVDIMAVRDPGQVSHHLEVDCNETQVEQSEATS